MCFSNNAIMQYIDSSYIEQIADDYLIIRKHLPNQPYGTYFIDKRIVDNVDVQPYHMIMNEAFQPCNKSVFQRLDRLFKVMCSRQGLPLVELTNSTVIQSDFALQVVLIMTMQYFFV